VKIKREVRRKKKGGDGKKSDGVFGCG